MRKLLIAALVFIPTLGIAQSEWEAPTARMSKAELAKQAELEAKEKAREAKKAAKLAAKEAKEARRQEKALAKESGANVAAPSTATAATTTDNGTKKATRRVALTPDTKDYKYLVPGAVPQNESGQVVFTFDLDIPGLTASQIYDRTTVALDTIAARPNNISGGIVLVNKKEHSIAAQYIEWLTFTQNFINLDRTKFKYMMLANCTDGHLHLTIERISYNYEEGRATAMRTTAEEWIADDKSINKKGNKLLPGSAKFRRATIDRKDELFNIVTRFVKE